MDNDQPLGIDVAVWGNVNISIAEILIDKGANVNARDNDWKTPLHYAASSGNAKVVELLIANSADVNAIDIFGLTAIYYALENKHDNVVKILSQPEIDKCDDMFIPQQYNEEILSIPTFLRKYSAMYPLHYAAITGNKVNAELLIDTGTSVTALDNNGYSPLGYAINNKHDEVSTMLRNAMGKNDIKSVEVVDKAAQTNLDLTVNSTRSDIYTIPNNEFKNNVAGIDIEKSVDNGSSPPPEKKHKLFNQLASANVSDDEIAELYQDLKFVFENPFDQLIKEAITLRGATYVEQSQQFLN